MGLHLLYSGGKAITFNFCFKNGLIFHTIAASFVPGPGCALDGCPDCPALNCTTKQDCWHWHLTECWTLEELRSSILQQPSALIQSTVFIPIEGDAFKVWSDSRKQQGHGAIILGEVKKSFQLLLLALYEQGKDKSFKDLPKSILIIKYPSLFKSSMV